MAKWQVERNGDNKDIITDGNGRKISYADLVDSGVDRRVGRAKSTAIFHPERGTARNVCDDLNRVGYSPRT